MLNKAIIMGRLTRDPELKYTQSQLPVVSFSVAVDRDYVRQGEQRETDFINVVAWRSTAEFISKWFHKGSMIVVEGKLQTRKWQDKYEQKRTELEIIADNVYFGDSKRSDGSTGDEYGRNPSAPIYQPSYQPPQYAAPSYQSAPQAAAPAAPAYSNDFRPLDDGDDDVPF
jgi:single-strand DNA-binding protein